MKFQSFKDLYHQLLNEAYSTERRFQELLPKVIEKTHSHELRNALTTYHSNSRQQHTKWEKMLRDEDVKAPKAHISPADNVATHLESCLRDNSPSPLLDAAIIFSLQQIEHINVATLGTLKAFANQMGEPALKNWFNNMTREELRMDSFLSKLAMGEMGRQGINQKAA